MAEEWSITDYLFGSRPGVGNDIIGILRGSNQWAGSIPELPPQYAFTKEERDRLNELTGLNDRKRQAAAQFVSQYAQTPQMQLPQMQLPQAAPPQMINPFIQPTPWQPPKLYNLGMGRRGTF